VDAVELYPTNPTGALELQTCRVDCPAEDPTCAADCVEAPEAACVAGCGGDDACEQACPTRTTCGTSIPPALSRNVNDVALACALHATAVGGDDVVGFASVRYGGGGELRPARGCIDEWLD